MYFSFTYAPYVLFRSWPLLLCIFPLSHRAQMIMCPIFPLVSRLSWLAWVKNRPSYWPIGLLLSLNLPWTPFSKTPLLLCLFALCPCEILTCASCVTVPCYHAPIVYITFQCYPKTKYTVQLWPSKPLPRTGGRTSAPPFHKHTYAYVPCVLPR